MWASLIDEYMIFCWYGLYLFWSSTIKVGLFLPFWWAILGGFVFRSCIFMGENATGFDSSWVIVFRSYIFMGENATGEWAYHLGWIFAFYKKYIDVKGFDFSWPFDFSWFLIDSACWLIDLGLTSLFHFIILYMVWWGLLYFIWPW